MTILKKNQRRNALNPKADGYFPVFVDIDFTDKCFVFKLFGDIFDDRLLENEKTGKKINGISQHAMRILMDYSWPGDDHYAKRYAGKAANKITRQMILKLLDECEWNKAEVGRRVGLSRTAIWKYMKKGNIPLKKSTG